MPLSESPNVLPDPGDLSGPSYRVPRISYAMNGEDVLIDRVFRNRVGRYIDIGAFDPVVDSNTAFFVDRGWSGVNIEPNPTCFRKIVEGRPDDLNLNLAVSDHDGSITYFEVCMADGSPSGLSTLEPEIAERHAASGFVIIDHEVPVLRLAAIIEQYGIAPPDILSIDVEGHEGSVLAGTDLVAWQPGLLLVEATEPGSPAPTHKAWEYLIFDAGYRLAHFNGLNRFYLRGDLAELFLDLFEVPVNVFDMFQRYTPELEQYKATCRDLEAERDALRDEVQRLRGMPALKSA